MGSFMGHRILGKINVFSAVRETDNGTVLIATCIICFAFKKKNNKKSLDGSHNRQIIYCTLSPQ